MFAGIALPVGVARDFAGFKEHWITEAAMRIISETGLVDNLNLEVRYLSHGQKQALELAMVLALEPRIILLDEPTAGLTKVERNIGSIMRSLVEQEGLACWWYMI